MQTVFYIKVSGGHMIKYWPLRIIDTQQKGRVLETDKECYLEISEPLKPVNFTLFTLLNVTRFNIGFSFSKN